MVLGKGLQRYKSASCTCPVKGYIRQPVGVQRIYRRFSKFAYNDVCVCVGKSLLTLCERVIQMKTLNPFDVSTFRLDALLQYK